MCCAPISLTRDLLSLRALRTQDRWVQVVGEETGEVRVRLAIVPGPPDTSAVQQMVALLSYDFNHASVSTLQVGRSRARSCLGALLSGHE